MELAARTMSSPLVAARRALGGPLPAVAAWAALILAARAVGLPIYAHDPREHVGAPPLVGTAAWHPSTRLLGAVALGLAVLWALPRLGRLRFRALLALAWVAGAAWAVLLAAGDGWHAVIAPLSTRYEYLAAVHRVGDPFAFLSRFSARLASYPTHVRGHPPGMVLLLSALDRIGLGGATAATVLVIGAGAAAAPFALIALRALAGEAAARRAAPFAALAPAAVWIATSADALFAAVGAGAAALFALAVVRAPGARRDALALAAGLAFGALCLLTYGGVLLAVLAPALAWSRRAWRPLALTALGALLVVAAFAAAGFWWLNGLSATHRLEFAGVVTRRPYLPFVLIGLAAFALALGPATAAGLAALRRRRCEPWARATWALVGGGVVAVAVASLSGFSRGETERVWLIFVPWLALACAALPRPRPWLALQLTLGVLLQAGVWSPW